MPSCPMSSKRPTKASVGVAGFCGEQRLHTLKASVTFCLDAFLAQLFDVFKPSVMSGHLDYNVGR